MTTIDAQPETEAEARERARVCGAEIQRLLEANRCRLVPYLLPPERVGEGADRMILQASYGIVPIMAPPPEEKKVP